MLPAEISISRVHLTVADVDATTSFYQDVLGFRVGSRDAGVALLSPTGDAPYPLALTEDTGAQWRRSAGLYHFAVLLPSRQDLARVLRHLIDAEAPIEGASDHGVSEALYLHDVEGNGIEMYADRPRERWTIRGGGLVMTTQALDVDDLLAQDTGVWEGLPEGTRIGHVHLRVADLARSEQFYAGLLGFEVMVRGYPGALFLSAGGYHHHIGLNTWAGTGIPPMAPHTLGLRSFTIAIPERRALDAVLARLRDAGVAAETVNDGAASGTLVRDRDGIGVLLAV